MKRATIILLLLVSCLIPGAVAAGEYPILDNQMETRHAHITWTLTIQEISMEAVVDYVDEVSEGNGTATLSAILTEFRSKMAEVGSYTTHIGLNNFLRDLKDTTTSFRTESRSRMNDYDGKGIVLLIRIAERLADSQGRLDSLRNQYWATRKANVLQNFDIRVERAQTVLDRLTERDYDTSATQAELDEIKTLRSDLEAALDAMDNVRILEVSLDAIERSIALAQTIRDARAGNVFDDRRAADLYYRAALVLRAEGKRPQALDFLGKAQGLWPTSPKILRASAELSVVTGRKEDAREAYARLVELFPDARDIDELRNALKVLQEETGAEQ